MRGSGKEGLHSRTNGKRSTTIIERLTQLHLTRTRNCSSGQEIQIDPGLYSLQDIAPHTKDNLVILCSVIHSFIQFIVNSVFRFILWKEAKIFGVNLCNPVQDPCCTRLNLRDSSEFLTGLHLSEAEWVRHVIRLNFHSVLLFAEFANARLALVNSNR